VAEFDGPKFSTDEFSHYPWADPVLFSRLTPYSSWNLVALRAFFRFPNALKLSRIVSNGVEECCPVDSWVRLASALGDRPYATAKSLSRCTQSSATLLWAMTSSAQVGDR
jgi:hypothetical protein